MHIFPKFLLLSTLLIFNSLSAQTADSLAWQAVMSSDNSAVTGRHESGLVAVNGNLYALGGRSQRPVERYNPASGTWAAVATAPLELHHFQPVAIGHEIFVLGAFTCCFPNEPTISDIYVFDTLTNTWSIRGQLPAGRERGSAAAFVYEEQIYLLGGNTQGHAGGAVAWFDRYDPTTETWVELPDAPHARDHFGAFVLNNRVVAAAGRQTSIPNPFADPVIETDVFNFFTNTWQSISNIPTARAGALVGGAGDEIIVAGGEIFSSSVSLNTVEAMNVYTGVWRQLQPLMLGRHSGGGAMLGDEFHVLAGSLNTGGAPETSTHEMLLLDATKNTDIDGDGLSNDEEEGIHNTDLFNPDSDNDGLNDGEEIALMSDPNNNDTDADGLLDGVDDDPLNALLVEVDPDNEPDVEVEPEPDPDVETDKELENNLEVEPDEESENEPTMTDTMSGSGGGSVCWWMLCALLVGRLARTVTLRVNYSSYRGVNFDYD